MENGPWTMEHGPWPVAFSQLPAGDWWASFSSIFRYLAFGLMSDNLIGTAGSLESSSIGVLLFLIEKISPQPRRY